MGSSHLGRVAVLVCTASLVGGCSGDAGTTDAPSPTISVDEVSPTTAGADPVAVDRDLSSYGEDRLQPGSYRFQPLGADPEVTLPILRVPEGFQGFRGFSVAGEKGPFRSVQVWTVDTVNRQPCGGRGSSPVGPSARDLAGALAQQRMLTATEPQRVELGGHKGLYLELTAPSGREYRRCSSVTLWGNDGGGMRYRRSPVR
jgi:hypothetical protein